MNMFQEKFLKVIGLTSIAVIFCKDRDYHVLNNLEVGPGDVGLIKLCEIIRPL